MSPFIRFDNYRLKLGLGLWLFMYSLFFGKSFLLGTYYLNCPTSRTVTLDSLPILLFGDGEVAHRHFRHFWQSVWQFDWSSTTFLVLLVWSSRSPYSTYRSTMYNPCLIYAITWGCGVKFAYQVNSLDLSTSTPFPPFLEFRVYRTMDLILQSWPHYPQSAELISS